MEGNKTPGGLFINLWSDLQQPQVLWQVGVLLLCLAAALLADRWWRRRRQGASSQPGSIRHLGQRGLQRLIFPLTALTLLWLAQPVLAIWRSTNLLTLAIPLLTSLAAIRLSVFALRQGLGGGRRIGQLERFIAVTAWLVVALYITDLSPLLIDMLNSVSLGVGEQRLTLWMIVQGLFSILAGLLLALWLGGVFQARLAVVEGLDSSLREVLTRIVRALLLVLAVMIGLPLVGIDLTMLSVFGGALGVGIGFGMQKIAANYISGFIILLDRSIRIGSLIAVGPERGVVTRITTRYTVLLARSGVEMLVPNEMLVSSVIANESYTDPKVRIPLLVQVAYGSDLERVQQILIKAALGQPRVMTDPAPKAHVAAFADSGVNFELRFWLADPENGVMQVKSDINLAIWKAFEVEGISIPFPQREVRLLSPQEPPPNEAAALVS